MYGYGLTEVSPLSHASVPAKPDEPGSVGYCLPNTECKIVDPSSGAELGHNEAGEIWIRGPQVMKGYRQPGGDAEMTMGSLAAVAKWLAMRRAAYSSRPLSLSSTRTKVEPGTRGSFCRTRDCGRGCNSQP